MSTDDFALWLAAFRERAGMSQTTLAKLTDLTIQDASQLEAGESVPSWTAVQLIAKALGRSCVSFPNPSLKLPAKKTRQRK